MLVGTKPIAVRVAMADGSLLTFSCLTVGESHLGVRQIYFFPQRPEGMNRPPFSEWKLVDNHGNRCQSLGGGGGGRQLDVGELTDIDLDFARPRRPGRARLVGGFGAPDLEIDLGDMESFVPCDDHAPPLTIDATQDCGSCSQPGERHCDAFYRAIDGVQHAVGEGGTSPLHLNTAPARHGRLSGGDVFTAATEAWATWWKLVTLWDGEDIVHHPGRTRSPFHCYWSAEDDIGNTYHGAAGEGGTHPEGWRWNLDFAPALHPEAHELTMRSCTGITLQVHLGETTTITDLQTPRTET